MSCRCYRSLALPRDAVGWSVVCDCGIAWSYSLTFAHVYFKNGFAHMDKYQNLTRSGLSRRLSLSDLICHSGWTMA